ncbi:MAG: ATPase [Oscillospiraceae bacterium]
MNCLKCFLGGASPKGFRTHFGEMIADTEYYTYIIKGGPGTGKSTLMKRLAEAFPDEEKELYQCSSDPDSLDAAVFKERQGLCVDGTASHTFDPEYPGASQQILDLGACWDASLLKKNKEEIISVTSEYLRHHASCRRFITALAAVADDTCQTARAALNEEKLEGFTERLAAKLLPRKKGAGEGKTEFRQLSALTPKGYITNVPEDYAAYMLCDSYFAGSDMFLRRFADIAASRGYGVSVSVCTLHGSERFEHILIPELRIAFMTADPINALSLETKQPINFRRFYDKSALLAKKTRLKFNEAALKNLRGEAVKCLVSAKAEHDRLEEYYIEAVDFDSVKRIEYDMISRIKGMGKQ